MASYNVAAFLRDAIESVLRQTLRSLEVIIVDDGSRDDTLAVAYTLAEADPRVRVFSTPRNLGPGGARNVALERARGDWFAILDADDEMLPDRLAYLVNVGEAEHADIVADDLIVFDNAGVAAPVPFLAGAAATLEAGWIGLADYLERTVIYGKTPDLGFLKPMIRTDSLRTAGIRYDETLRIAEDDDLIVRMLSAGLRYRLVGFAGYRYRRHGSSTSHRLSAADAANMRLASAARVAAANPHDPRVRQALAARHRAMSAAEGFARWVEAVKARRFGAALRILLAQPAVVPLLRMPLGAAWHRLASRGTAAVCGSTPTNALPSAAAASNAAYSSSPATADDAPLDSDISIDICICTFRRSSLDQTLASIARQRLPSGVSVRVIVADNDAQPERRASIVASGAALGLDLIYRHAPVANIAIARNACLDTATAPLIAFIDDDEIASLDWLAQLLAARAGADIVFGVSQALYSDPAIPKWVRQGDFHSNRIMGNDAPWNGYTANVLIDRHLVTNCGVRFDPAFGQTGGEDTQFFYRLHQCGARFAYRPDAIVFEETPRTRATLGWLLRRRYRAGQIHQRLQGGARLQRTTVTAKAALKAAVLIGTSIAATSRRRAVERLLRGALHIGVVGAGVGLGHYREYADKAAGGG